MNYEIVRISIRETSDFQIATGRFLIWERDIEVLDFELEASIPDGAGYAEAEDALKKRFAEFAVGLSKAVSA